MIRAPRKEDCSTCATLRDASGRMMIGLCGPRCLMRQWRNGTARWNKKLARWERWHPDLGEWAP